MSIITRRFNIQVVKLLLNVLPNLSILQEGIELNDLHDLFLVSIKFMQVEPNPVESAENSRAQIVVFDNLAQQIRHVRFIVFLVALSHIACSLQSHAKNA